MNGIKRIKEAKREKAQPHASKILKTALLRMLYMIAIPIVIIVIIIAGLYLKSNIEVNNAQVSMKEYLQSKYGQEFVVEKPKKNGGGLGVEGHLDAVACPKNDKTIRFTVMSSSSGISDGYAGAVWTKSENERMMPIIRDIFGEHVHVDIEIKTSGTFRGNVPISGSIPSFSNGAKKYGRAILYTLYIKDSNSLRDNESEASSKVFRLLPNINSHTDLIFSYRSQVGDKSYGISLNQDKIKDIKNVNDLSIMYKEW